MKRKKILFFFLGLLLLYFIWLSYHILSFRTYKVPRSNISLLEIKGAYHIHSAFSDGRKHPDKIAELASSSSVQFIILADHGNPNYESLSTQGWKHGVLVLAGSELSVSRGHLVALNFEPPSQPFSQNAEEAVYQTEAAGGFSIIAHPYSKVRWSWGKFISYSGMEIINADTMLKKNPLPSLPFLPLLLVKPDLVLLKILDQPEQNLRKWDALNTIHPIFGYFSTDAHLLYRSLLRFLHLYLLLDTPLSSDFDEAKNQIFSALKQGRFYNAISAAAEAQGFRFWGTKGERKVPMGGAAILDSSAALHVRAPFPFAKEICLIHDGNIIFRSQEERASFPTINPGTYRVEVYLKEKSPLSNNIPWIVSNPIFLRKEKE